ncbi:MAG: GGDEF domain-containing protein [Clostridium sp.]|nr:GGDEF domain-containing protein [Acetatifactor muris]MCM1526974.1 GGDEF domain-containing protein [Bacteroides sp.]MCM1563137.1 GGDEF domain-containing protein [Clostridium sp.]
MENQSVYEVKVNKATYDVISANTAFYAFMGSRIYNSFDHVMDPTDAQRLPEYVKNGGDAILTMISEEGEPLRCLATFTVQDEALVDIRLLLLEELKEREKQTQYRVGKKNGILSLYGDYFFEYEVAEDNVRIYAADRFEQNVLSVTFEEFEQKLLERADESNEEDVRKLIATLRAGTQRFIVNIAGDILNLKETAFTLFKGISYHENGEYIYSTGYVHFWNERSVESAETKRAMERDYLTGVLTKAEISNLAINIVDVKKISNVTIAIIDIDYFKKVNDVYGHMMGDEVLKKVANIIQNEVREDGLVGRFGGDEFVVVFYDAYDMETMRERLRSIKNGVASSFVKTKSGEDISITLSIGCAAYPKDADNYEDLFFLADFALYRAKEKGRNRYIIYNRDKHGTLEDIKNTKMTVNTLNSRGNMSMAELICAMQDKVYTGQSYPLDELLDDVALNLNIQRVMLYAGRPSGLVGMAGANRLSKAVIESTRDYALSPALVKLYDETGVVVVDNVRRFESSSPTVYEKLTKQGIFSFVHVRFKDKNGTDAILSLEYVKGTMSWNRAHLPYYRLLARLLSEYDLGGQNR